MANSDGRVPTSAAGGVPSAVGNGGRRRTRPPRVKQGEQGESADGSGGDMRQRNRQQQEAGQVSRQEATTPVKLPAEGTRRRPRPRGQGGHGKSKQRGDTADADGKREEEERMVDASATEADAAHTDDVQPATPTTPEDTFNMLRSMGINVSVAAADAVQGTADSTATMAAQPSMTMAVQPSTSIAAQHNTTMAPPPGFMVASHAPMNQQQSQTHQQQQNHHNMNPMALARVMQQQSDDAARAHAPLAPGMHARPMMMPFSAGGMRPPPPPGMMMRPYMPQQFAQQQHQQQFGQQQFVQQQHMQQRPFPTHQSMWGAPPHSQAGPPQSGGGPGWGLPMPPSHLSNIESLWRPEGNMAQRPPNGIPIEHAMTAMSLNQRPPVSFQEQLRQRSPDRQQREHPFVQQPSTSPVRQDAMMGAMPSEQVSGLWSSSTAARPPLSHFEQHQGVAQQQARPLMQQQPRPPTMQQQRPPPPQQADINDENAPPPVHQPVFIRSPPGEMFLDLPFTQQIKQLVRDVSPLESEYATHRATVHFIESIVHRVFGADARVHQFGSTASGMSLRGAADMDVCIELTNAQIKALESGRLERERALAVKMLAEDAEAERKEAEEMKKKAALAKDADTKEASDKDAPTAGDSAAEKPKRRKQKAVVTLPQHILELLGETLEREDRVKDILVLVNTRIPIVKYRDAHTNINVDIGYNNLLAVHNTQLLYTYSLIDERVKELVMLVKLWARRRFINDTYSGTLSSYAYVVMVIHFLQSACHPPVLPVLQTLGFSEGQPRKTIIIDDGQTFDVDFFRDIQHLDQVWPYAGRNQDSVGKLFYLFLHYWAHEFEYRRFVASIRETRLLTKAQKDWVPMIERKAKADDSETVVHVDDVGESPKVAVKNVADAIGAVSPVVVGNVSAPVADEGDVVQEDADESKPKPRLQRYWICIEDPFEITHNLGRPVGRDSLYFIRGEFLQAIKTLQNTRNYPRTYMQELREAVYLAERSGMSAHKLAQRLRHPDLLARVCEESPYQTRADHKERNRENMQFSDRRKGVVRGTGAGGNAGGEGSPAALGGAPAPVSGPQ